MANLWNDAQQETLADAMTDALVTELTQCSGVRVLSRSSMLYKGRRNAVIDVAEELDVEWIVLASMTKVGSEIRITALLVEAASDENRWASSYSRQSRNVLAMQSEVAADIARHVASTITQKSAGPRLRLASGTSSQAPGRQGPAPASPPCSGSGRTLPG